MKTRCTRSFVWLGLSGSCAGWLWCAHGQTFQFTAAQRMTNGEAALTFTAPTGRSYRLDAATNAQDWSTLFTFPTNVTTSLQHTDSAAPWQATRFYRAAQFSGTNILSGDHLATTNGDVVIRPVDHASFVLQWDGKWIYSDPASGSFAGIPKADLILISHSHGDHYSQNVLGQVWKTNDSIIVAPQAVYNNMSNMFKNVTIVMTNTAVTNVLGLTIQAVPAYNGNHALGAGNGYVLTLGGKRIYISGDTGNQPEIRALPNIDVAFLCMNQPFTMTVSDATNCIRAMLPRVVYPYHYRDQSGATTNAATFKQWLGTGPGIEVRLRKWY